jgi:hypothetical protein
MTDVNDITSAMNKVAQLKRYNHDKAKEIVEDSEVIRDSAQDYLDREPYDAIDGLIEACEALEDLASLKIGIDDDRLDLMRTLLAEVVTLLPSQDSLQAIVDNWDTLNQAVDDVTDHVDNPREYDREEKQSGREDVNNALVDFSSTLDGAAVTVPLFKKEDEK